MTTVAHGIVEIDIHDEGVVAGLKRIGRSVDDLQDETAGKETVLDLKANVAGLKQDLGAAKKEVTKYEQWKKRESAKATASEKGRNTKALNASREQLTALEALVKQQQRTTTVVDTHIKKLVLQNRAAKAAAAASKKAGREAVAAVNDEKKAIDDLATEYERSRQGKRKALDREITDAAKSLGRRNTIHSSAIAQDLRWEEDRRAAAIKTALALDKANASAQSAADDLEIERGLATKLQVALRGINDARSNSVKATQRAADAERELNSELDKEAPNLARVAVLSERHSKALIDQAVSQDRLAKKRREIALAYRQETDALARLEAVQRAELDRVPQLENQYQRLQLRLQAVRAEQEKMKRADPGRQRVGLEEENIVQQMTALHAHIRAVADRDPIPLRVEPTLSARAGERLQLSFRKAFANNNGLIAVAAAVGADLGAHAGRGFVNRYHSVLKQGLGPVTKAVGRSAARGLGNVLESGLHRLGRLSEVTVRLGPFTTTIRTAIAAMSIFGPLLIDIAGGFGALIGTIGSATLGVGALSAAFVGGAIPAILGMVGVLKPVIAQFKQAATARKGYNSAIAKGNDELAAKKLKELQSVLGNVDKGTAKSIASWDGLKKAWADKTIDARASVFHGIGQAINFANRNVETFGKNTNETADALDKGFTGFLNKLDVDAFDKMHDSFNTALTPMIAGLGNLVNYFAAVGASASHWLTPLSKTFENWSSGLVDSTNNTGDLNRRVDGVVNSARTLGRFFLALGRTTKTFFGTGVGAGNDFVQKMTDALDRWRLLINSDPKKFSNFFVEAVKGTQAFFSVLQPVLATFVRWAAIVAPAARVITGFTGVVAGLVEKLMSITLLRGPMTAIFATVGALLVVGKIKAMTGALTALTGALFGVSRGGKAVAAADALQTLTAGAGMRRGAPVPGGAPRPGMAPPVIAPVGGFKGTFNPVKNAGKSVREIGLLRAAVSGVGTAFGIAGTAGATLATGGLALVAGAAVYGAYKLATMKTGAQKLADEFKNNRQAAREAGRGYVELRNNLDSTAVAARQGALSVKEARKALAQTKKGTTEHAQATLSLRSAEQYAHDSRRQFITEREAMEKAADTRFKTRTRERVAAQKRVATEEEMLARKSVSGGKAGTSLYNQESEQLAKRKSELADAIVAEEDAANARAAAAIAGQRAYRGFSEVVGQAEQKLGSLYRTGAQSKKIALKIATTIENPQDVGKVAASAGKSLRAGVKSRVVLDIVANSKNAEQAIRRLQNARVRAVLDIITQGGDEAKKLLADIKNRPLTKHEIRVLDHGTLQQKLDLITTLDRYNIKNKDFTVTAKDNATSVLNNTLNLLRKLGNKTITLTTVLETINKDGAPSLGSRPPVTPRRKKKTTPAAGGIIQRAGGGPLLTVDKALGARQPNERQQARALQTASLSGSKPLRSGRYKNPTLLVGEEHRTEDVIVISRNPAYRERNKGYLAQAANALGMNVQEGRNSRDLIATAAGGKGLPTPTVARGRSIVRGRLKKKAKPRLPPRLENFIGPVEIGDLRGIKLEADRKYAAAAKKRSDYQDDIKNEKDPKKRATMKEKLSKGKGALPTKAEVDKLKYIKESVGKVFSRASRAREKFDSMEHQIDVYWKAMETLSQTENPELNAKGIPITDVPGVGKKDYNWILKEWKDLSGKKTTLLNSSLGDFKKQNLLGTKMGRAMQLAVGQAQLDELQDPPKWEPQAPETPTLDQAIQDSNNRPKLADLLSAAAFARTTNDKGEDDKARAEDLRKFYVGLEPTIKGMPKYNNPDVLAELYNRIGDYSDFEAGPGDSGPTSDELAVQQRQNDITIGNLRSRIVDQTVSGINKGVGNIAGLGLQGAAAAGIASQSAPTRSASFASEAVRNAGVGGSPSMSGVASQAAQSGPSITINTLHPGDPNTLRAIGDAATAGLGFQNPIPASRGSVGI